MSLQLREPFYRGLTQAVLNCGRPDGQNPILSQAISVYRVYDSQLETYRPFVVPVTQIFDPFCEFTYSSTPNPAITYLSSQPSLPFTPLQALPEPRPLQRGEAWFSRELNYTDNPNQPQTTVTRQSRREPLNGFVRNDRFNTHRNNCQDISDSEDEQNFHVSIKKLKSRINSMEERLTRQTAQRKRAAGEEVTFASPLPPRTRKTKRPRISNNERPLTPATYSTPISPNPPHFSFPFSPIRSNMASNAANDNTAPPNEIPLIINRHYMARPVPNFKIDFNQLSEKQKLLHIHMRGQPQNVTADQMNAIYEDEQIYYTGLNQNPSLNHQRVNVYEALSSLQETVLEMFAWKHEEWRGEENKQRAKSKLEAAFDIIFNIWHELDSSTIEIKSKAMQIINELDLLYNRVLDMTFMKHLKSPLMVIGMFNPLIPPPNIPQCHQNFAHINNAVNLTPTRTTTENNVNGTNRAQGPSQNLNNNNYYNGANRTRIISSNNDGNNGTNRAHINNFHTEEAAQSVVEPMDYQNEYMQRQDRPYEQNAGTSNMRGSQNNNFTGTNRAQEQPSNYRRKFDDTGLKIVNTIKSWPNKFDGRQGNFNRFVESWLQNVTDDIPAETILNNIEYLLEHEALDWHRIFGRGYDNWYDYANAIQTYFNQGRTDNEIEAEFESNEHNQKENENFMAYLTRIQSMANKLTQPINANKLFERVKRGLHSEYLICRLSAKDMKDLMAKCATIESTKATLKKEKGDYDPFEWLKHRSTAIDNKYAAKREEHKTKNNEKSNWNKKISNFRPKGSYNYPSSSRQNYPQRYWKKFNNRHHMSSGNPKVNELEAVSDGENECTYEPELTRGQARELNSSDEEFLEMKEMHIINQIEKYNMSNEDFACFQTTQICSNCHIKGHSVDQCDHAKKGIWFEHCKKCNKPNVTSNNCNCSKN